MAETSQVAALFEGEPTIKSYKEAVQGILRDPQRLGYLTEEDIKGRVLINLTNNCDNFAQFFRHLRSALPPAQSQETHDIAARASDVLAKLLPDLHQLLRQEPGKLVQLLCPAVEVCLAPSQPRGLRNLASVITGCDNLLGYLAADPFGSAVVRQWTCFPGTHALDFKLQAAWTETFVSMVATCPGDHNIAQTISRWGRVDALNKALRDLEGRLISEESRKAARAQPTKHSFPSLEDELISSLKAFNLPIPGSRRMVQNHMEALSSIHTPSILRSVAASFPCKHCMLGVGSKSQNFEAETNEECYVSDLDVDILGKGIGVWKLLASEPVLGKFQTMSRQGIFNPVREKLTDLASGRWDSRVTGSTGSIKQREHLRVPLTSTECGRKLSILWQVSIGIASDMQAMQQVILLWDVGDWSTNSKTFDRVIVLQRGYSEETVRRCCQRLRAPNQKQIPARFDDSSPHDGGLENRSTELDVRTVDQATIQMANKFYTVTEPMMYSIVANNLAAEFPFDLSRDEARCITNFQTASLILGRSGTGKTTCLIFKMVGKYLTSKAVLDARPARQILLTRSRFLAEKIKAYSRRLIKTLSSKSVVDLDSAQVDDSLLTRSVEQDRDSDSVLTLRDESFPLVCTFDRFLQLLENTAIALDRQDFRDLTEAPSSEQVKATAGRRHQPQLVDFYAFKLSYWPRFPEKLLKGVTIHLVFAEIMGVIKGSESSRESLVPLSREEYLARSSRLAPTFANESDRSRVYDIYKVYEILKSQNGDFDYIDRVVRLLGAVRRNASLLQALRANFDEVYIDEVQDQRCLDLELLMNIVRDGRGFHFAGDTAQAISQDSTFRFEDVKKMLFSHFAPAMKSTNQSQLGHATRFDLSKNYRSHQGILALASLIMDMMWKGFPETMDKLPPEIGNVSGPKPVVIIGCDVDILRSSNVGSGKFSERSADFGAEQVILVRDDELKTHLQNDIGETALILTIFESKGMEFDDVILWDFFTGCADQAGVRSLNSLKNDPVNFDRRGHSGMCPELKILYVAITRARYQLFIIETSEDTGASVQSLLLRDASGTITEVTRPDHDDFAIRVEMMRPSASVDPVAWARRAEDLMEQRYYKEAFMSFRRAGDRRGETIARGHVKEEEGSICLAKDDIEGSTLNFDAACGHFMAVKLIGDAVRVLVKSGNLNKAAVVLEEHKRPSEAAELFLKAGSYLEAVRCYHDAGKHTEAAGTLRSEGQYEHLISYLSDNKGKISTETLKGYSFLCKLLLKQDKLSTGYRKQAIILLGSSREQETCFREYGMDKELEALYTDQQRHKDLYHLFLRTGQLQQALIVALVNDLLHSNAGPSEFELLQLFDYLYAGHLISKTQVSFAAEMRLHSGTLTPSMKLKMGQWLVASRILCLQDPHARQSFTNLEDTAAKFFITLRWLSTTKILLARPVSTPSPSK